MAYPWLSEENFDDGTRGNFDSETDASSILDFPDYKTLALGGLHPWQGSHALRVRLSGTATADITETGGFDTALAGRIFIWLPLLISSSFTLNDGDAVILFALQSAGPVNEVVVGIDRSGANYRLFAGETGATNTTIIARSNKQWHQIELDCLIDSGPNDGTIDFYVDGGPVGAQIASLDQAAISQAQIGAISGTAAGNTGTFLVGGVIADEARVYPRSRFGLSKWITRDMNAFVGPSVVDSASVTGTGTDAVMTLLDTDVFLSTGIGFSREPVAYVRNITANDSSPAFNTPTLFKNGVYVQLAGTNPQGFVSIRKESAPVMSAEGYLARGLRRKASWSYE